MLRSVRVVVNPVRVSAFRAPFRCFYSPPAQVEYVIPETNESTFRRNLVDAVQSLAKTAERMKYTVDANMERERRSERRNQIVNNITRAAVIGLLGWSVYVNYHTPDRIYAQMYGKYPVK
jgi:hypothetical protein